MRRRTKRRLPDTTRTWVAVRRSADYSRRVVALLIPSREAEKAHPLTPSTPQSPASRPRVPSEGQTVESRDVAPLRGVRTLLDEAGIARSLLRIAHEIVERT